MNANALCDTFLDCVRAITCKETQLGTSSRSKLVRGRVRPFGITYVRAKNKKYLSSCDRIPQNVVWHHSWHVSGCWVKIRGVGKDREGKRVVKGLTWRVPHIKGSGPLTEKVRVMVLQKELASSPKS
jgi:hypothetical protein